MKNERTSKRIASIAGRILRLLEGSNTEWTQLEIKTKDIRALAASALTQRPDNAKAKRKRKSGRSLV